MITKEGWVKRRERYGKSGCKNPERKIKLISGKTPWNKGKKFVHSGSFKKGRVVSEEIRKKLSIAHKGKPKSEEFKANLKGKRNSPSTEFKKGIHNNIAGEYKKGSISVRRIKGEKEQNIIKEYKKGIHAKDIALNHDCSVHAIYNIIRRNKIKMRGKRKGEKHERWKGGVSFEPYDKSFNLKFKRAIRKRDNQICMLCGVHREKLKEALNVHHINYDKFMSVPQNCISLCRSCHSKTNMHRKSWELFFHNLLEERYGYKYENNKVIMEICK